MRIQLLWGGKDNMTDRKGTSSNNDHRMIVLSNGNNRETSAVIQANPSCSSHYTLLHTLWFHVSLSLWNIPSGIEAYSLIA